MTAKTDDPRLLEVVRHFFNRENPLEGGMTVFATHIKGNSYITVATAICAKGDSYCKKEGYAIARERMNNYTYVQLPIVEENTIFCSAYNKNKLTRDNLISIVNLYFGVYGYGRC